MPNNAQPAKFLLCLSAGIYSVSLEPRKLYRTITDSTAEAKGFVRVLDESGEDYLYPRGLFAAVELPAPTLDAITVEDAKSVKRSTKGKSHAGLMLTKGFTRFSKRYRIAGAPHAGMTHPARPGGPPVTFPSSPGR